MKRLTLITRSFLFFAFPLLVLNCGGTAVDEDHGEMMEHDGVMDEVMPHDSVDHVMGEEGL